MILRTINREVNWRSQQCTRISCLSMVALPPQQLNPAIRSGRSTRMSRVILIGTTTLLESHSMKIHTDTEECVNAVKQIVFTFLSLYKIQLNQQHSKILFTVITTSTRH